MIGMTNRQREILHYIRRCTTLHGRPPTRKEIADQFNFASTNAAQCHLVAMQEKGLLQITPRLARGIQVVKP